jgi:hypothetical protein
MSSRWRGLTHEYLRTSLEAVLHKAMQLPTPPSSPYLSAMNAPRTLLSKRERELFDLNIKGIRGILNLVCGGNTTAIDLEEEFGESIKRIQEQAVTIAKVVREGVMSGWFELVRLPDVITPSPTTDTPLTPAAVVGPSKSNTTGKYKGKGKMNHYKGKQILPTVVKFDEETMENIFKGFGREEGAIMCTVEFGLDCVKKEDKENCASVDDTGGRDKEAAGVDTICSAQLMDRRILMKPRVLLESVNEIL